MSNSPLEVMRAIVENGGPIEAWVKKDHEDTWERRTIIGVDTASDDLNYMVSGGTYSEWYQFCSLTDPTKKYVPLPTEWTHDWARWRAVDSDGSLFEYDLKPYRIEEDQQWIISHNNNGELGRSEIIDDGHDPTNWENSLEERPRKTRPMTAREFAKFVGENMGRYLYRHKNWINHVRWESDPLVSDDINLYYWLYAENVEGELDWKELPEVSE